MLVAQAQLGDANAVTRLQNSLRKLANASGQPSIDPVYISGSVNMATVAAIFNAVTKEGTTLPYVGDAVKALNSALSLPGVQEVKSFLMDPLKAMGVEALLQALAVVPGVGAIVQKINTALNAIKRGIERGANEIADAVDAATAMKYPTAGGGGGGGGGSRAGSFIATIPGVRIVTVLRSDDRITAFDKRIGMWRVAVKSAGVAGLGAVTAPYTEIQPSPTKPGGAAEVSLYEFEQKTGTLPWYKKWYIWAGIVAGVGAVGGTVYWVLRK